MARRWLSGKKEQTTNTGSTPDKPIANWYRSIHELPLKHFETVYVDQNLFALVITPTPTIEDLSKAWENIQSEYADRLANNDYKMYLRLFAELNNLKADYQELLILTKQKDSLGFGVVKDDSIGFLRKICYPENEKNLIFFRKQLYRLLRYKVTLNPNDPTSYFAELDKCERRAKAIKVQYDMKALEFEGVEKKFNTGEEKKQDRDFFTSMLVILSKHFNYRVTKDITVAEYCAMVKQYNLFYEKQSQ